MKRKGLRNGTIHDAKKESDGASGNHVNTNTKFMPGDVIWIKLHGTSWWPAQIVDENAVCSSMKPRKKGNDDLLVRLYGTYEYSFVDPVASRVQFDNVLKQHEGSHKEIMEEALRQDCRTKVRSAKTKGKAVRAITEKEDDAKKKSKPNGTSHDVTPQKTRESIRRLKVMQGLGLMPPSGSPYLKNGQTLTTVQ